MRDHALFVILLGFIVLALYRPWLGVLGLAVLGFMHPHGYGEGFMRTFPAFQALLAATTTGYAFERFRLRRWPELHWDWRLMMLALLFGWYFVSAYFALAPIAAREKLVEVLKILPPLVLVWLLIDTREKLFLLLVTIALSIALVTIKGGYWAVMTGFGDRVYGPPGSQFGDNNEFSVAVAMTIPLLFIWLHESRDKLLYWVILGLIVLSFLSALSSWSRGGLLSLIAMSVLLVWHSRRKMLAIPIFILAALLVPMVFSEQWLARMGSILAFQDDGSAQSRLGIWRIGWEAALKDPLTGHGFNAWPILSESNGRFLDWHSAYIEMLAEHGFVGLVIWGVLFAGTILSLGFLIRRCRQPNLIWAGPIAGMLQAALVAYLAGALTLGIAYWELPLWLIICAMIAGRLAVSESGVGVLGPSLRPVRVSASLTNTPDTQR
jgi:probable O-glycosylation ligase (exosortase A-associated)